MTIAAIFFPVILIVKTKCTMVASSYIHDKHDCWIRFVMEWFWTLATRNVAKSYCETFVLPGRYVECIYTKLTAHASWKIKLEKIMSQAKQLYLLHICSCFGCPASCLQLHWNTQTGCATCTHLLLMDDHTIVWAHTAGKLLHNWAVGTCKSLRTASQWSLICQCASRNCFHRVYSGSKLDMVTIVQ